MGLKLRDDRKGGLNHGLMILIHKRPFPWLDRVFDW